MTKKLERAFFEQPTLTVAEQLLGKIMVFKNFEGAITETEAYIGFDDPACHAVMRKTAHTQVMHGPAGHAYVYLIYGMYHCLNFVTEADGFPAAVLIRSLQLTKPFQKNLDGPGKLCRQCGIDRTHNGMDIVNSNEFYVKDAPSITNFKTTKRIGITRGMDKLWRFLAV